MKAIEFKTVSFNYEGYEEKVLNEAHFDVNYGEIALLSGYSGEGKSTVLGLISGIIPNITAGEITGEVRVAGEDASNKKISQLCRDVAVVLQNAESQIIQQLVEDEIAFGCENFAFSRDKTQENIEKACERMELEANWRTRSLSGGQKQRLITAASLATEQRILILDEPLANLDKVSAQRLMQTLKELANDGYAILLIEHRLDLVIHWVDRVWQIQAGKIKLVKNKIDYLREHAGQVGAYIQNAKATEVLMKLENLSYHVGDEAIIQELSLDLLRGERLLLLGDNGSGKTSLLRLIAGLLKPSQGTIHQYIDPKLRKRKNKQWFKRVGVVYQNPNYQLFMPTVREEIHFAARSSDYADWIMERFALSSLSRRHPHSLSEGQKRRLSIAAVAATGADLLLLDEPTVGQDYAGLESLIDVLNEIHYETANTMITITHDMRCAEALCDRAVLMEAGQIKAEGEQSFVRQYFTNDKI